MKVCKKCGAPREGACKPCRNAVARAWVAANQEKRRASNQKYYAANHEQIYAVNKVWRQANADRMLELFRIRYANKREEIREKAAAYHIANKEAINERSAAWQKANPEKCRIQTHNRRAKVKAVGGTLSKDIYERLFKLQKGKCACCGKPLGSKGHLDHIMPIAMGGKNEDSNTQLLTQRCNNQKHAKHPVDFMQSRGFLL